MIVRLIAYGNKTPIQLIQREHESFGQNLTKMIASISLLNDKINPYLI